MGNDLLIRWSRMLAFAKVAMNRVKEFFGLSRRFFGKPSFEAVRGKTDIFK